VDHCRGAGGSARCIKGAGVSLRLIIMLAAQLASIGSWAEFSMQGDGDTVVGEEKVLDPEELSLFP